RSAVPAFVKTSAQQAIRRYSSREIALEKDFKPAVVVSWQRRHNAFIADFAPVILVEQVPDTREDSRSPLPKLKFGREVPNVVGGNKAFEGIAIVTKFIVNKRAKKREFEGIFVAIDRAGLDLIIRSVCRCLAAVRTRGEFGIQQCDVTVKQEVAVGTGSTTVDQ